VGELLAEMAGMDCGGIEMTDYDFWLSVFFKFLYKGQNPEMAAATADKSLEQLKARFKGNPPQRIVQKGAEK